MNIDFKNVTGIAVDSRLVKSGFIFVAIKGEAQDGHEYVDLAIRNGAKIIIHQSDLDKKSGIDYFQVDDCRIVLSELAANFYKNQPEFILGITGTSGKSSIVHFVREILRLLNKKSVSIGTLGVLGDYQVKSNLTTPPTIELHKILQEIANHHIDYCAIECSSHGIDQKRLSSVNFKACGFSNFSRDHLDYHKDMDDYFNAKKQLFKIMKNGYAVLNSDIKEFEELKNFCLKNGHELITYGKGELSNIKIKSIIQTGLTQEVSWDINAEPYLTKLNLVGEFQIYNIACAIGLLISVNIAPESIMKILEKVQYVPGRMELVGNLNNAGIFVDYAHKPEALSQALQNLRKNTFNKVWVIFGCGGERDQGKRSLMGEIACEYADHVIITDDNPRNEDPKSIRQDILKFCNEKALEIASRKEAINFAMSKLQPGDNLLIAGKGHENYQIIGKDVFDFSDKENVLNNLKKHSPTLQ
jgi:UDP-N-acetylmuramoyl-L-alanyl-D-glutamate--2,6-diaminopimelate ligase